MAVAPNGRSTGVNRKGRVNHRALTCMPTPTPVFGSSYTAPLPAF